MLGTSSDITLDDPTRRAPLVLGEHDTTSVTDTVCGVVERPKPPRAWYVAFAISSTLATSFLVLQGYLFGVGVGVWGLQNPVGWAFDIINFVFWVGIGHAGTLISAILFLFRQKWRTGINRAAEAMTIFAVICALIYPGIHLGRWWMPFYLLPYPNAMQVWPNFRSPLLWDVFAVGTYFTVSLLFWYMGMVPDLASLRDRATTKVRKIAYGIAALGWRGSHRHWHRYERAYLILAALATPLVLSVHSVVSFDFAVSILPGWHSTIFPPYFVAGAIFSGFAMVATLLIPAREWFGLKDFITLRHLENMCKIILATGSMVGYAYGVEFFIAWYSGNAIEQFTFLNRALGPYAWAYWIMVVCNVVVPQAFWLKRVRTNVWMIWILCAFVNVGMWFERFVIIVTSLANDFLPSSWGYFTPTWVDLCMLAGSFGIFLSLFLLFCRFLPMVAMAEVKSVMPHAPGYHGADEEHALGDVRKAAGESQESEIERTNAGNGRAPSGLLAEFESPADLIRAAEQVRQAGYRHWDAHTPYPVHGLGRAMAVKDTALGWIVLAGGIVGCFSGLVLQWWTNAVDYPVVISGKPFWSLPANIPITFELTVLFSAIAAFVGMFVLNGLPKLHHWVFEAEHFQRVTSDRYFISIESSDPKFDLAESRALLASTNSVRNEIVWEPEESSVSGPGSGNHS
ncbi:MAG: DUF3341 domain-containing protein [Acidobacteria bacterium]|nr:DUF3341 domain-containing protein [Acidobacteriota bacterium]